MSLAGARGLALSLAVLAAASLVAVSLTADAAFIRSTFGLTEVGVGAIASCIYLGATASSVTGGRLTDSYGPGPTLVLATLLLACGALVAAGAPSVWVFYAGVLVAGVGYGIVNPPTNVLANPRSAGRRGLAMSIKQSGIPLGGIVAGAAVPFLADQYGWRWSLALPIGVCLVLAVVFARSCPTPALDSDLTANGSQAVRLRLPHAYAFGFLMGGVQVAIFAFLALYLVDDVGMTTSHAGSALALLLVGGLVGRPGWGWVSDRVHGDRPRVLQATSLIASAGLVLMPFVGSAFRYPVLVAVGLSSVGWNGVFVASVSEAAEPGAIGVATGRALLLVSAGAVLIPPGFGWVVHSLDSWTLAWVSCGVLSLLSGLLLQVSRVVPAAGIPNNVH
jgi:MFS family permease